MTPNGDRRTASTEDPVVVAMVVRGDDHEARIRGLEKFRYMAMGALAVLTVLFPTTIGVVLAGTSH